jgi:antitoxin YefM
VDSVSVNQFRDHLKTLVDQALDRHQPLKVTRRGGGDFVVIGAEEWEREQETLFVLQNGNLMRQIADSLQTHAQSSGYRPTPEEVDAIIGV